jgi:hypothetical protein
MGLLAPWFLAGLVAVGLPVFVHLLQQFEAPQFNFSSLMFFERHIQSSVKFRRLKYLLLFALRTALIVLLILAFADPFVKRQTAVGGGPKLGIVAMDNSFSMRAGGRIDRAKSEAESLIAAWPQGRQGQVLAFAAAVQVMTPVTTDTGELRGAMSAIAAGDSRSSYAELVRGLRGIAEISKLPLEVHLFSDMQSSSMPANFVDLRLPDNTQLIVHSVAREKAPDKLPNWTVESVAAPRRVDDPKKTRVTAVIAGYGTPAAKRQVSLVINGHVAETKTAEVPANGHAKVEFLSLDVPHGLSRCEVRIDSADKLPDDDRFFFAVDRGDPQRLLFVHDLRHSDARYFRNAIDAAAGAPFQVEAVSPEQSVNTLPTNYAVVVLSDVAELQPTFIEALRAYVRGGGGLLIALGSSSAHAAGQKIPVFDETIAGTDDNSEATERFHTVAGVDRGNPAVAHVNSFENVKFYQTIKVNAGESHVLARLDDQTPLVLEKRIGEGRVLVFTSTFDNVSNDLPLHAAFVPFVDQAAGYLAGQDSRPGAYVAGSYFELRTAKEQGVAVDVMDPTGARPLTLAAASSATTLPLVKSGFYSIRAANGHQALAAVNADRRESDLAVLPVEDIALWQNTGQGDAAAGSVPAGERAVNFRLWWYVMIVAFLVALAETWVGAKYLNGANQGSGAGGA